MPPQAVVAAAQMRPRPPLIASWVGDSPTVEGRAACSRAAACPSTTRPGQAVLAFMHLVRYRESQRALMETPPSVPEEFAPDAAAARAVIERALADGRDWLTEPEAKNILAAYGIPVAHTRTVADAEEAVAARRCDRLSGRGQDPLARPHAQVRCRRRRPRSGGRCPGPRGGRDDARARRRGSAPGPDRRLCGAADDPPAERARVDRRRIGRRPVRPGDPVRPWRHGGRDRRATGRSPCRRSTCALPTT